MSEPRTTTDREHTTPGLTFAARPVSLSEAIYGEIATQTMRLEVLGHSEAGRSQKRSANQDFFYVPAEQPNSISTGSFLFTVADGVGGANHGEKASEIAVKQILSHYYAHTRHGVNHRAALTQAVQHAHQTIKKEAQRRQKTMATTFLAAMLPAQAGASGQITADFACIGDSRAYLLRPGQPLKQVTRDSLWYEDEQKRGDKYAQRANAQVQANPRLMQSPRTIGGAHADIQVDFFKDVPLRPGDIILLCTDGIYKPLGDSNGIGPILQRNAGNLNSAATVLLNTIRRRGRLDDATLVLIRVTQLGTKTAPVISPPTAQDQLQAVEEPSGSGPGLAGGLSKWAAIAAVLVVAALLVGVWLTGTGGGGSSEAANGPLAPPPDGLPAAAAGDPESTAAPLDAYPTETPAATATFTPAPLAPTVAIPPPTETALPTEPPPPPATEPPVSDPTGPETESLPDAETAAEDAPSPAPGPPVATIQPPNGAADCAPGDCKYSTPPPQGLPAPNAVYDSDAPFEFGWGYVSLDQNEFYDLRIYHSPTAAAPVERLAVRDQNFVRVALNLPCRDYFWSIRIGSATELTPDPASRGRFIVDNQAYTGARSPESSRSPFTWRVNCQSQPPDAPQTPPEGEAGSEQTEQGEQTQPEPTEGE